MDLNRISVFVRVVEEGSFTKAARALGLPKSSVSRSVSLLEEEIGVQLLQRSSRNVTQTDAGAAYYQQVTGALASIQQASAQAAEARSEPKGAVRVTAPFSTGNDVLLPIIARFSQRYPGIRIDLSLTNRYVDLAAEGVDLAVRGGDVIDESLIARKIAEVRFGLYASPAYLDQRGVPKTLADLPRHDAVVFRGARGDTSWPLSSEGQTKTVQMTGRVSVDDLGALRSAALAGLGIALLAPFNVAEEVAAGELVRVLPAWVGPASAVSIVYAPARFIPQRVVLLREFLLEELRQVVWTCTGEHHGKQAPPRSKSAQPVRLPRGRHAR